VSARNPRSATVVVNAPEAVGSRLVDGPLMAATGVLTDS
jgi:hypothetical protein